MTMADVETAIGAEWVEILVVTYTDGSELYRFFSTLRPREAPPFLEAFYTRKNARLLAERLYDELIRKGKEAVARLTSSSAVSRLHPSERHLAS